MISTCVVILPSDNLNISILQAFALQNGGLCYSGPNSHKEYGKYGVSYSCVNGLGGFRANDVYMFGQGTIYSSLSFTSFFIDGKLCHVPQILL